VEYNERCDQVRSGNGVVGVCGCMTKIKNALPGRPMKRCICLNFVY